MIDTSRVCPVSIMPLFGRTQYLLGAVVCTLKHTCTVTVLDKATEVWDIFLLSCPHYTIDG